MILGTNLYVKLCKKWNKISNRVHNICLLHEYFWILSQAGNIYTTKLWNITFMSLIIAQVSEGHLERSISRICVVFLAVVYNSWKDKGKERIHVTKYYIEWLWECN